MRGMRARALVPAAIPVFMLTFAVPLVNRIDARLGTFPLLLLWIAFWVSCAPLFLYGVFRMERR